MTLLEKVKSSAKSKIISLCKEGLFYKCYNEDAMVFAKKVKMYNVNARFVKNVGAEVLSLGFPESEVEKGNWSFDAIKLAIGATSIPVILILPFMRLSIPV